MEKKYCTVCFDKDLNAEGIIPGTYIWINRNLWDCPIGQQNIEAAFLPYVLHKTDVTPQNYEFYICRKGCN